MSRIFFTSDLHFGHKHIVKFCPKTRSQFKTVQEMDEFLISTWNDTIKSKDDIIVHVGDFSFYREYSKNIELLNSLNGKIILIKGNHDEFLDVESRVLNDCKNLSEITSYKEINFNKTKICIFHYPMMEWNKMRHGSIHIHGHLHGTPSGLEKYRTLDVGFDATERVLITLEEVYERTISKEIKTGN